ncbi:unnamed protein product [Candidula unifasciata]|uniref:Uncharacterized protein n=1 Tax=Candidula unifasciata TaxID=100452 RepID=A0A8S3YV15_9EUPU|nr:unnamed protein product [Candidula unifasciata]
MLLLISWWKNKSLVFLDFVVVVFFVFKCYEPPHVCKKLENESTLLAQYDLHNTSDTKVEYGKCDISIVGNRSGVRETVASFGCMAGHDYHGSKHISFVSEVT